MVSVSLCLYGDQAKQLHDLLNFRMDGEEKSLPMQATFEYRSVEGRAKIYCSFVSADVDEGRVQEREKDFERRLERKHDVARAVRGF